MALKTRWQFVLAFLTFVGGTMLLLAGAGSPHYVGRFTGNGAGLTNVPAIANTNGTGYGITTVENLTATNLNFSVPRWTDALATGFAIKLGANAPSLDQSNPNDAEIQSYFYGYGDDARFEVQSVHSLARTNATFPDFYFEPHLHCMTSTTASGTNATFRLKLDVSFVNGSFTNVSVYSRTNTTTLTNAYSHYILSFGNITNNLLQGHNSVLFRGFFERLNGGAGDIGAGTLVSVDSIDIHVPLDQIGSAENFIELPGYYVDATLGNDTNSGTSVFSPWKTLAYVTNQVFTAGDVIYLKRGEMWSEPFVFKQHGIELNAYGSAALPLPIIDGGGTVRTVVSVNSSNTTTKNIQIQNGGGGTGSLWANNISGTNTIADCTLINHATDAAVSGTADSHTIVTNCIIQDTFDDGLTLHATASMEAYSCTISNCTQAVNNSGTDMWMLIRGCTFVDNDTDIGPLSACNPVTIDRCVFNGRVGGTQWKFIDSDIAATNTVYSYCTFNGSIGDSTGDPAIVIGKTNCNTTMLNCVFYGGGYGGITIEYNSRLYMTNCIMQDWWRAAFIFGGGTFTADHCIFTNITVKSITSNTSELTTNPSFVNASTGNFRLQAGSPAIDSGIAVGLTTDLDGNVVGDPPERGAYEYIP